MKLLPQATSLTTDGRKRALLAVVSREQHYGTCLQFGLVRFVSPLAERADLITPSDHQLLFQNIEEVWIGETKLLVNPARRIIFEFS